MEQGTLSFGGSWTEEKLEILRKYLNAYTTALKKSLLNCFTLMRLPEPVTAENHRVRSPTRSWIYFRN